MAQFIIGIIIVVLGVIFTTVGGFVVKDGWEKMYGKDTNKKSVDIQQTATGNDNTQAATTGDKSPIITDGDYVAGDKIDVSNINNNVTFRFNGPVENIYFVSDSEIRNLQTGAQSGAIATLQTSLFKEGYFKYLPNGLNRDKGGIETSTSRELKRFFNFTKSNFTKTITGKQFKEMNSLLNQILSEEPDFVYAWFYRGLFFSFASVNPEFKDKFSSIAESSFKKADDLFNILLEKHPNDPFLLLYKGMNLTLLNRAEESVSYLKKSLSLEPDIFQKKHVLGIIACWNHIAPNYLHEWQTAMEEY